MAMLASFPAPSFRAPATNPVRVHYAQQQSAKTRKMCAPSPGGGGPSVLVRTGRRSPVAFLARHPVLADGPPDEVQIRFIPPHAADWIGALWTTLECQVASTDIMCSWTWTETWLRHYGDRVQYCFALGECRGEPIGIALVTCRQPITSRWFPFRGIVHLGTAGEPRGHSVDVDYNRLLAAPSMRAAFGTKLIAAIYQEFRPFAIRLDSFVPDDVAVMASAGVNFRVASLPCPAFDLDCARRNEKDVLTALGSGVRGRIRRSNRGFGELHGEWATTTDHALDIYDELMRLHQARWQQEGRRGAFASIRFAGFHREYISRSLGETPRVMLFRLREGSTTIGCLYGFIEHGMVLFYQSGFIEVADNRLKPGLSTHAACMQESLDRGLSSYNFLKGEARYKRELADSELLLQSAIAFRYPSTASLLDTCDRLGLTDRARAVKRWRERTSVAAARAHASEARHNSQHEPDEHAPPTGRSQR